MSIRTVMMAAGVAGFATLAGMGLTQAKSAADNDALSAASAPVSLEQAVSIARQTVPGVPSKAQWEQEEGAAHWSVEIVDAKQQVHDLAINATTGAVVHQALDQADHADDERD
ncbi:PepSY domain-containing protein [Halothiobacillus sp. DCM-1]|uniref:PepSY domain-containing protein n=1 Tax=Halothiobacillus sp. DCM-1 TaxID=3112558 RepID=UPI003246BFB0